MALRRRLSELLCPLCREGLGGASVHCEDCQTAYHVSCREELGGCAVLGCAAQGADQAQSAESAEAGWRPSLLDGLAVVFGLGLLAFLLAAPLIVRALPSVLPAGRTMDDVALWICFALGVPSWLILCGVFLFALLQGAWNAVRQSLRLRRRLPAKGKGCW